MSHDCIMWIIIDYIILSYDAYCDYYLDYDVCSGGLSLDLCYIRLCASILCDLIM